MHIVFLNPVSAFGGAERSLLAWMTATRQAFPDARIHLIVPEDGLLAERAKERGITVEYCPISTDLARLGDSGVLSQGMVGKLRLLGRGLKSIRAARMHARRMRSMLNRLKPDLVHSNGIKTHLLLGLSRWRAGPIVWHIHDFIGERPMVGSFLRWASKRITAAVAVSKAVRTDAQRVLQGVPITVVYNTTDTTVFCPGAVLPAMLDELSGMPPVFGSVVRVGLVATFARWKGHDVFMDAAALVLRGPIAAPAVPIRFYVIGGPIYQTQNSQFTLDELMERARRLDILDSLGFVPFQPDPVPIYRALDIVVHASVRPEPFGLTIIEAMACGRATIVSQAGGAAELGTAGVDAVYVPPGDNKELSTAIQQLIHDATFRDLIGVNGRNSVIKRFSSHNLSAQVRDFYGPLFGLNTNR